MCRVTSMTNHVTKIVEWSHACQSSRTESFRSLDTMRGSPDGVSHKTLADRHLRSTALAANLEHEELRGKDIEAWKLAEKTW